ncbi:MAG: ABC transporter substrate-binding protein [Alphaproteobacteria bacterium]|nr:ABC transporter substrate-binding protein [Alphaproteobacteria bacterium]
MLAQRFTGFSTLPCLAISLLFGAWALEPAAAEDAPQLQAQASIAPAAVAEATDVAGKSKAASDFVQGLGDNAVAILADKNISKDARDNQFRDMLQKSFDLNTIGRFVVGRTWYGASDEQQAEYLRLFEKLVIKIYSERFALYSGEKFTAVGARQEGGRDYIVDGEILHPGSNQPIQVNWRVRDFGDHFGVIDVVVEGVSMSVTQRQEYMSVIQRNGGEIEPLLQMMRERLDKPSQQAVAG